MNAFASKKIEASSRILGRVLAKEITEEEMAAVAGGALTTSSFVSSRKSQPDDGPGIGQP
jgi:bacteriocin-like protein